MRQIGLTIAEYLNSWEPLASRVGELYKKSGNKSVEPEFEQLKILMDLLGYDVRLDEGGGLQNVSYLNVPLAYFSSSPHRKATGEGEPSFLELVAYDPSESPRELLIQTRFLSRMNDEGIPVRYISSAYKRQAKLNAELTKKTEAFFERL